MNLSALGKASSMICSMRFDYWFNLFLRVQNKKCNKKMYAKAGIAQFL